MKLEISCAMCGKRETVTIDTAATSYGKTLGDCVLDAKWIYQQNGANFDIYCSDRCAA